MNWYKKAQTQPTLIIMRGLPGSGKSTTAQEMAGETGIVLSTDDYFMVEGEYQFDPEKLGVAHKWNQERAKQQMALGKNPVIIDNTNVQPWEARPYVQMADEMGYDIQIVEPSSPWWTEKFKEGMSPEEMEDLTDVLDQRNTHGVPRDIIRNKIENWQHNITDQDIRDSKAPWEK